ncbi:MAG: hypothetical protein V8R08_04810 [Coriobacteriales bacterium]
MREKSRGEVCVRIADEVTDRGKRQVACAKRHDLREATSISFAVDAITRIGTLRREQALLLVVPERAWTHTRFTGHLANRQLHAASLPSSPSFRTNRT